MTQFKTPKQPKIKDFEVQFDKNGNLLERYYKYHNPSDIVKEPNKIFSDTLEYTDYVSASQGGNSKIQFTSLISRKTYNMFITDFNDAVLARKFINNLLVGDFYFCRKGTSQGVRLIIEDAP